jgi:uncharacterized protein YutD
MPLDPLTGASLLVMAFAPADLCKAPAPVKINIVPKTAAVKYDYTKSFAELQTESTDTINPYGYSSVSHTNGYMSGRIATRASVKLDAKALSRYDAHCVWYEEIIVNIEIEPTIVIATEVAADRCMHAAVKTHELKHVSVDRKIVNKYANVIGRKVYEGLKQRGFIAGPVRAEHAKETADRMRTTVNQIINFEFKKMDIERSELQQKVDSLEEYQSVSAKCPDYVSPAAKLSKR